jgi:signal peptidase II
MAETVTPAHRSPRAVALFVLTLALALTADLWTKYHAFRVLPPPGTVAPDSVTPDDHFIPHLLHFTAVENRGAVFGVGQGMRTLFLAFSLAAIPLLVWLFVKSGNRWWYQVVLGLLLAGVIGNLYDRAVYHHVRDMIYLFPGVPNPLRHWFPRWDTLFPWVFNLADTYLCTGVFVLLVHSFFEKDEPASRVASAADRPGEGPAARSP